MSSTARPKAGSGANAALRDDDGARRVTVSPELIPALALGPDRAEACLTAAPASADWDAAAKAGAIYDRRRCRLVLFGLGRRAPVRLCETALDALWQAFGGGAEVVEEVLDLVAAAGDPPALVVQQSFTLYQRAANGQMQPVEDLTVQLHRAGRRRHDFSHPRALGGEEYECSLILPLP